MTDASSFREVHSRASRNILFFQYYNPGVKGFEKVYNFVTFPRKCMSNRDNKKEAKSQKNFQPVSLKRLEIFRNLNKIH